MRSVSPKVYTKDYYLTDCTGYSEFSSTYGKALEPRLARIAPLIPSVRNKRILDIGCGRGEMVLWAAERGSQAYGIDYSKDAILLSKKALSKRKRSIKGNGKATFQLANGKELPYKDSFFDMVFLFEVLEHLYPEEQDALFDELQRVVKPNGVVLIHTAPSRTFQDFTYKLWCYPISSILVFLSNFATGHAYGNIAKPTSLRSDSHKIMHVNEPTFSDLDALFHRHHFSGKIQSTNVTVLKPIISWKDRLFNFLVYLHPVSQWSPFNRYWGNDFFSVLHKTP